MTATDEALEGSSTGARSTLSSVLANRDLRLLFLLQFVGGLRQPMQFFAQAWYVNTVAPEHMRVLLLGVLSSLQGVAYLAYILFGGALADRIRRRTMLLITHSLGLACLIGTASLLLLPAAAQGQGPWMWVMMVVFMEFGVMNAQDIPARTALVAEVAPPEQRAVAANIHWMAFSLAFIVAAPLVGQIIQAFGFAATYYIASCGHVCALLLLFALRHRGEAADPHAAAQSLVDNVRDGVRYMGQDAAVRWVILVTWLSLAAGTISMGVLVAAWVRDVLHLDAGGWGVMALFWGVGGVAAALLLMGAERRVSGGRLFIGSVAGFGVAVLGFAYTRSFVVASACFFLAGACFQLITTLGNTITQALVPNRLLGRVMGLLLMAQGIAQGSGVIMGGIAQAIGITAFYPLLGVFILVVSVLAGSRRSLRAIR